MGSLPVHAQVQKHAAPKEEWVLRWLLKKLKADKNYRVEPDSFLLLKRLVDLIPPKRLAMTLSNQRFLDVLHNCVVDLKDAVSSSSVDNRMLAARYDSETSHTISDSAYDNDKAEKRGMKRKRMVDEYHGQRQQEHVMSPASCFLAFVRLMDSLYSLVVLANGRSGVDEVSSSHLKRALRGPLESVAMVLGRSLQVATMAAVQFSQSGSPIDLQHIIRLLPAVLDLWELRSSRLDTSESESSNVRALHVVGYIMLTVPQDIFTKHCFLPDLEFLLCLRSIDIDGRLRMLHGLKRLIALHSVLPVRAGFFGRGGSGIDYSTEEPDWGPVQPVTQALGPLFSHAGGGMGRGADTFPWKRAELLPIYFDAAARSVPRDTFRRQTHESPWLETLFVALAELAFSVSKEESGPSTPALDFVRVLEMLFQVALRLQVHLSLRTLLTHAVYTGLLKKEPAQVEWNLTALLIELGVDIFLPNSGINDSARLLDGLLQTILMHWCLGPSSSEDQVIKYGIVIPLLNGFAAARDFSRFVELWSAQLSAVEGQRLQNNRLGLFSVWEDEDICSAYSVLAQTALTDAQILDQVQSFAINMGKRNDKVSKITAYAESVILDGGLRSRTLNLATSTARGAIKSFTETLCTVLSSKHAFHWRWRLWRLARNILERRYAQSTEEATGITDLIGVAAKRIVQLHKSLIDNTGTMLEALETYDFILMAAVGDAGDSGPFDSATGDVVAFVDGNLLSSTEPSWNGRLETVDSPVRLALAYFFTVIRNPVAWRQMKPETRRSFLSQLLTLAVVERGQRLCIAPAENEASFAQAWGSIVCHEYLLAASCVTGDLVQLLSERVKNDEPNRRVYVDSIQRIPVRLITRRQRGRLLDVLLAVVLVEKNLSDDATVGILSLLATLAEMPKSSAAITCEWGPLWKIAKTVQLHGTVNDIQITKAFRTLHHAVMDKLLSLSGEQRGKLFRKLYRRVSSRVSKLGTLERDSMVSFFLRIMLSWLWTYRSDLADVIDEADLAVCRHRMFELVLAEVKRMQDRLTAGQKTSETVPLVKTFNLLEDFEDLVVNNGQVVSRLSVIAECLENSDGLDESLLQNLARHRAIAGSSPEKGVELPLMQGAQKFPLTQLYSHELQLFVRAATALFRSVAEHSPSQVIEGIIEAGALSGKDGGSGHSLFVAGLAVASIPSVEDKDSAASKELSWLCSTVTASLRHSTSIEQFSFATECLDMFLRNHGRCITQWNIDDLLTSVSICASPKGPRISPEFAPTIYTRLCRLMGMLFGLHRQRLGGRFHLILPAMQRLLGCLFTRANNKSNTQPPYWLGHLSASHAVHYTRLLTSLCDPTVSAVSRPSHNTPSNHQTDGLTDQTKKAKRMAGQYLQYLIMEYAQCSLRSSLMPEVKAAIIPGLYAVLDVMSKDTMRALNTWLDVSGRAVFKGLYDDYVKFGKWNKG